MGHEVGDPNPYLLAMTVVVSAAAPIVEPPFVRTNMICDAAEGQR